MKLYAWTYNSYGLPSFFVMAESERDARAAVEREIATWPQYAQPEEWREDVNYTLQVLGPGEAIATRND